MHNKTALMQDGGKYRQLILTTGKYICHIHFIHLSLLLQKTENPSL